MFFENDISYSQQKAFKRIIKKMILFLIAITIRIVFSDDNTNIIQISKTDMLEEKLKREFGCTPTDEYKLIDQSSKSGFVENVCLPTSYQVMKPPDISIDTPVYGKQVDY